MDFESIHRSDSLIFHRILYLVSFLHIGIQSSIENSGISTNWSTKTSILDIPFLISHSQIRIHP